MEKELADALYADDPKTYVTWWLENHGYEPGKSGLLFNGGDTLRMDELKTRVFVDYHIHHSQLVKEIAQANRKRGDDNKLYAPKYKKKDLLHSAVDLVMKKAEKQRLKEFRESIKYAPDADPGFSQVKKYVANITNTRVNLGEVVLRQFIYIVKRKVFGLEAEHHIVPVLMGPGGKGKSKNVERLLSPVKDYLLELTSAAQLTDERAYYSFSENYVATLDEFSKMDKAEFNSVKNFITAANLSTRILYTNQVVSLKQNTSIFGTSNYPINELIFESAGMRRFYEFVVDKVIDKSISESVDYVAMWKSVNENGTSPILPHLEELSAYQESLRTPDPIEEFFAEFGIDPNKPCTFRVESRNCMYKAFKNWAKEVGFDAHWINREQNIRTKLLNRGLKQKKYDGQNMWYVNEDCKLNPAYDHGVLPALLDLDEKFKGLEDLPELEQELLKAVKAQDYVRAAAIKKRIDEINGTSNGLFNI